MSSYVSIVGLNNYFGSDIFKVGQILVLRKDYENNYDDEAIQVEIENVGKVGYIANSTHTVVRGCKSAGRIYDTFLDKTRARVMFIMNNTVIAEIIEEEEEICQVLIRVLKKSSGQWQTN
jgi:hypothetical protein